MAIYFHLLVKSQNETAGENSCPNLDFKKSKAKLQKQLKIKNPPQSEKECCLSSDQWSEVISFIAFKRTEVLFSDCILLNELIFLTGLHATFAKRFHISGWTAQEERSLEHEDVNGWSILDRSSKENDLNESVTKVEGSETVVLQ